MKDKILGILFVLLIVSCSSNKKNLNTNYYKSSTKGIAKGLDYDESDTSVSIADKVIWTAFSYKGVKYKYGGLTKRGIDCSGLVMKSFEERGIKLPRSSVQMASKSGRWIRLKEARRGDLLFFTTSKRHPSRITHVGIVSHVKDGGVIQFIHASTAKGVVLDRMDDKYYRKSFAGIKRVL